MSDPSNLLTSFGGVMVVVVCAMCCSIQSTKQRERERAAGELQAALLQAGAGGGHAPSRFTTHRLEAASRDAEEGFNACAFCGFENFKRIPFCNLCGAQIVMIETTTAAAADGSADNGVNGVLNGDTTVTAVIAAIASEDASSSATTTQRQKRARSRKEWVRKMDIERNLFWYRDRKARANTTSTSGNNSSSSDWYFPGYTLKFVRDTATPSPEQLAAGTHAFASGATATKVEIEVFPDEEPFPRAIEAAITELSAAAASSSTSSSTQELHSGSQLNHDDARKPKQEPATEEEEKEDTLVDTSSPQEGQQAPLQKAVVVQHLEVETAFQTLVLVDATAADASEMPLARLSKDAVNTEFAHWRQTLKLAKQDFPSKYAYFVTSTAALLVHASKQYIKLNVLRGAVLQDSLESLSVVPRQSIRSVIRVDFVVEAGVDAGGLQREWFVLLTQELADPANGVFKCVSMAEQIFYLNPNSAHAIGDDHLMYYFAVGRLIGRSLLEGQVLGFHLALPLLKIILGVPLSFPDLQYFDPEAYKSLVWIMRNNDSGDLGLTFSIMEQRGDGMVEVDLIENGRDIDVTDDNKDLYLERKFRYLLFESVSSQLYCFLKGLYEIIPQELLMVFDPEEFDYVLCGSDDIDVDDWQKNTRVSASLHSHKAIKWFWEFVREMPNEYRRRLLHFATGSSRVPLGGFAALTSVDGRICPFTLKGVKLEENEYIASRACFNRLDVPLYDSRVKMGTVLFAILETELHGFTTD